MKTDHYNNPSKPGVVFALLTFLLFVSQAAQSANRPPVISGVPALQAAVGSVYTFIPQVKDPNQDKLKFRIRGKPAWAYFDRKTGVLSGIPAASHIGKAKKAIIISVSDGKGGKANLKPFKIAVVKGLASQPVNSGPTTPVPGVAVIPGVQGDPQANNPVIGNVPGNIAPIVSDPGNDTQPQTPTAEYQLALQTGDASHVTEHELALAADTFITNTKEENKQSINSIFKLAEDGSLQAGSISGIYWNPSHDSVWLNNLNEAANVPVLVTNNAIKDAGNSQNKVLGIVGVNDTARYAVMGGNPLHDLARTTESGGSGNAQLSAFLKSQLEWLTQRNNLETGSFKVVIAHQSDSYWFRHDATTRKWFTTFYPNATVNANDACESALLASCLSGADLLVIGRDSGSEDNHGIPFDLNATMAAVKAAQANGIPVLYVQYDGGMNDLGLALMDYFGLTASDNYWRQEYLDNFEPTQLINNSSSDLDAVKLVIDALDSGAYHFAFEAADCINDVGTVKCDTTNVSELATGGTLQSEFFKGVEAMRTTLQALDKKAINVFDLDNSYTWLKTAVLLGDKYRQQIHYPMDKVSTDNTAFFKALYADYTVHYARPNNAYQPDMGDFTDAQAALNSQAGITKTVAFTPTQFDEWSSTGLYAPPGKTISIRRMDASPSQVKIKINVLRQSTRLWNSKGYSRPRYMSSMEMVLEPGKTYAISTPYGGPIYVGWQAVASGAVPFTLEFGAVLNNPLLASTDDTAVTAFSAAINASNSDWVDIKTPYAEVHSLKSYVLKSFDGQDGINGNGYTNVDVKAYINDLNNYLILGNYSFGGIVGEGIPALNNDVSAFCAEKGLTTVSYDGSVRNLCTDPFIHAKPRIQHINADINAACGGLCAGNPFDSGSPIDPLGWGENHEMGHNLQATRLKVYGSRSGEVSNNIFPLHTQWRWTVDKNLSKHPSQTRPANGNAYQILQSAIAANTPASIDHPLWAESGIYDKAFERLSFYMQLGYTQQSWDVYTKLYILDHILKDATKTDAKWNAVKVIIGMGSYTRAEATAMPGNDFLYVMASTIAGKNYSNYFTLWGIEVSQAAIDQVTSNRLIEQVPSLFYYVNNELPAAMPSIADTLPLDGVTTWHDPTP